MRFIEKKSSFIRQGILKKFGALKIQLKSYHGKIKNYGKLSRALSSFSPSLLKNSTENW